MHGGMINQTRIHLSSTAKLSKIWGPPLNGWIGAMPGSSVARSAPFCMATKSQLAASSTTSVSTSHLMLCLSSCSHVDYLLASTLVSALRVDMGDGQVRSRFFFATRLRAVLCRAEFGFPSQWNLTKQHNDA